MLFEKLRNATRKFALEPFLRPFCYSFPYLLMNPAKPQRPQLSLAIYSDI